MFGDARLPDRFWAKVRVRDDGCWQWHAARTGTGYSNFCGAPGHRTAYMALVGPVPAGLVLDHLCRNRACVNPDHLEPVTHAENLRRGVSPSAINQRKTHCPQGHPLTPDNLRNRKDGRRACLTCYRASMRRMHARKRAEVSNAA